MTKEHKITILNSRQGLFPCRLHTWIQQTLSVLNAQQNSQTVVVSSIGMSTWDIVTVIASSLKMKLELHIQKKENITENIMTEQIIKEYCLNPLLVSFVFISEKLDKDFQTKRDISIVSSADIIFPVSIRPKGNLENLIIQHSIKIDKSYQIPYQKRKEKIAYTLNSSLLNSEIQNFTADYIFHWTKTSKDKYPFETQFNYYNDILQNDNYPRRALDTLINILKLKIIIATPTHMPQNISTVSFTSLTPFEMVSFFKWRSRYQEMSFEPYGIGIKKSVATLMNIKQVIYYDKIYFDKLSIKKSDIWLTQSKGIITNWESENEYRHLGNLKLEDITKDNMILFTRYKNEADQLNQLTGIQTISFVK